MKKRKVKRFEEGGAMPDIDREPLRDSSGRRVRSGMDTFTKRFDYNRSIQSPNEDEELEGSDVMSGSTEARQGKKFPEARINSGPKGYLDDDIKGPVGIPVGERKPPPGLVSPYNPSDKDLAEPGTAGFSKTLLKTPTKAAPVKPASGGGRGTMAGPTAAQIEEGRKKFAEDQGRRNLERLQKEDKPLERVNPEANLIGGPALRGVKALATGLAGKMAAREAPAAAGLLSRSKNVGENLTKDMGPVQYAGKRSMLQNQRGEGVITPPAAPFAERNKRMLMQNQRGEGVITPPAPVRPPRGGGKDPGARRLTRDELDEMRMGSDYMRKGGRVKAYKAGGSVSSASKRADGIAMRGKTRGKYI